MVAEGSGPQGQPDDGADIDARFEEIVAGLKAEHAQSQQRRQEAIRRAQAQRRAQNRPLEGFDNPNPWPPTPSSRPEPPADRGPSRPGPRGTDDGVNPPLRWGPQDTPEQPSRPEAPRSPAGPSNSEPPSRPEASGYSESRGYSEPSNPEPRGYSEPAPRDPGEAWRSWEESDEEEHFIPPTPPLPAGDLHLWAIIVGLLGGPLLLILSEVFNVLRADWWTLLGIGLSVAGVVLLFMRLPKNRDYTDTTGGAQV